MTDHYQILGLSRTADHTEEAWHRRVKAAYRAALLQHHPDKIRSTQRNVKTTSSDYQKISSYSVDQITKAYSILSDPVAKTKYDQDLNLSARQNLSSHPNGMEGLFRTGVEIVDLDDLALDQNHGIWSRGCRCGDLQGFMVREEDLESATEDGELDVGCRGCSLWLKVLFGTADE